MVCQSVPCPGNLRGIYSPPHPYCYLESTNRYNELREKKALQQRYSDQGKEQDIYEIIGEHSRNVCSGHDADLLILYALNKLFKRPVFLDELRHAGVRNPPDARQVEGDEKEEARRILSRAKLKVPDSNPAYVADAPAKQSHFRTCYLRSYVINSTLP